MRGIYSFVLVFVFMASALMTAGAQGKIEKSLSHGMLEAMEIESASFFRFELEENTDLIIEETIDSEIRSGNHNGFAVNKKITSQLQRYYMEMEEEHSDGVKTNFFEVKTSSLSKNFTPNNFSFKKLGSLDRYCKTVVLNLKKHVFLVRFEFTGGIMKDNAVLGRIKTHSSEQYFLVLPGYSIERVVVA